MVMAQSCGLTSVASGLALLLGVKENSVRQRMREWYYGKEDKRGRGRCEMEVSGSFVPLLRWILSWWPEGEKRLALALDATQVKDILAVLVVSVVYRGCAIPIAWRVLPKTAQGAWKQAWVDLLSPFPGVIPADWMVIVMADRGLYASWLFDAIQQCHWHPYLRINRQVFFRPGDEQQFRTLQQAFQQAGCSWVGKGTCFKTHPRDVTLVVQWEADYPEPWLVLTDLAPELARPGWYGLRTWIECGFKHLKRAGWQWQSTRMRDPERATRFWLALAVATLWVLSVGGQADAQIPACSWEALPDKHIARRHPGKPTSPARRLSCFRRGLLLLLAALFAQQPLPAGRFIPEPWPS